MRLGLIPVGHAVIVVATAERRSAIAVFNLEAQGLPESNRVGHVPPVSGGIRLFKQSDSEIGKTARAQAIGFAEIILRAGALNRSEEHTSELQSLRHLVCR